MKLKLNTALLFAFTLSAGALFFACKNDAPASAADSNNSTAATTQEAAPSGNSTGSATLPAPSSETRNETGSEHAATAGSGWPGNLPASVPAFSNIVPGNYTQSNADGVEKWTIDLKSAKVEDLAAYKSILTQAGFKTGLMAGDKGGLLSAKKDNVVIYFTVTAAEKSFVVEQRSAAKGK